MKTTLTFVFLVSFYFVAISQWKPTNGLFSGEVHSVIVSNNEIVVGTKYIYKSTNDGKTWFVSNNGITGTVSAIRGLVKISTNLVAITDAGAFYSSDNGNNWMQSAGTAGLNCWSVITKDSNVFLSTIFNNGIYKSTNNGVTWAAANIGITTPLVDMRSLAVKGTDLYTGSDGHGIFKSTNDGLSWTAVNTGLPGTYYAISTLAVSGNNIIAGTYGAGVYKSANNGISWSAINNGISATDNIMGMGLNGNTVYASTMTGNLFKTTDCLNWNSVSVGTYMSTRFETFFSTGNDFFVGCWGNGSSEKSFGLFKTTDDGLTWKHIGLTEYPVSVLEVSGNNIIAGTNDISGNSSRPSLYKTTETDSVWSYSLGGINTRDVTALKASGAVMYLFDNQGPGNSLVYRSTNNGNNWTSTGYNVLYSDFKCFVTAGSIIYAGDNSAYATSEHVYVSSDNGATWNVVNSGLPSSVHTVYALTLKGTLLFLATDNGIYKNTVGSNNWTAVNNGLTNLIITSLYASGTTLYAGTQGSGIFKSGNDGALWTDANSGIPLFANITCFAASSGKVFAGSDNGIFVTSDLGNNWTGINTGLVDTLITAITASANYLWVGTTSQGVWRRELTQITTGIKESEIERSFCVFPNPATTSITIQTPSGNGSKMIYFYNSIGKLVVQKIISEDIYTLDLNNFPKGIYFVKLINGANIQTEKLIIR